MILSLFFQNCSSQFSSQGANSSAADSSLLNFTGVFDTVRIMQAPSEFTNKTSDVVRYQISPTVEQFVDRVEYQLNNDEWQIAYDNEIVLTALAFGAQGIYLRTVSKNGSVSETSEYNWFVDYANPEITIDSKPDAVIASRTAQIFFTIKEPNIQEISCSINQEIIPDCKSPINLQNLMNPAGHEVRIYVKDLAGNSTEQKIPFSVWFFEPTYTSLNLFIFSRRCAGCHNATSPRVDLTKYPGILSVVTPTNAATSNLYIRVTGGNNVPRMPLNGIALTDIEIQAISDWINTGALNN